MAGQRIATSAHGRRRRHHRRRVPPLRAGVAPPPRNLSFVTAYLDHAATTPMRPEAVEAMLPFLGERFGNPSGSHAISRDAKKALEEARDTVAECLGCHPGEVVFTGSGTKADNLAVLGVAAVHGHVRTG